MPSPPPCPPEGDGFDVRKFVQEHVAGTDSGAFMWRVIRDLERSESRNWREVHMAAAEVVLINIWCSAAKGRYFCTTKIAPGEKFVEILKTEGVVFF
ncbi:hypothetical protein EDB89DRAFT_2246070 [Lactarius sanguifluus]|nr:hypothetical protein EDB89DRAFT_2246070 [Lactarius sanguifluus]